MLDISKLQVIWSKPYLTEAPHLIVVMKQVNFQNSLFVSVSFFDCQFIQARLIDGSNEVTAMHYNQISVGIAVGVLIAALQVSFNQLFNFFEKYSCIKLLHIFASVQILRNAEVC